MKVAIILFALFYAHIARGSPLPENDKEKAAPAAPQADSAAAPAAEKPDICKVNVNGKEETLQPGDRYCKDDSTNGVCGYGGETHEFPCDSGFKCHKHPNEWKVTCLQLNLNQGIKYGEDGNAERPTLTIGGVKHDAQHDSANAGPAAAPQNDNAPAKAAEQPANPPPPPPKQEEPAAPTARKHEEPAPPPQPTPKKEEPAPAPKKEEPETPKPETCKATIDGQEQTLQPGDRYCLSDTVNRVCNWGEFVDYECPNNSKCLKSPDKWQVLCRIVNRGENTVDKGAAPQH